MAGLFISRPKLSPERAHRTNKGLGTLQRSVLQNAASSLFILFRPQAVQSQERLRFFYPLRQMHLDDRTRAEILGEGSRNSLALADNQGRAPWLTVRYAPALRVLGLTFKRPDIAPTACGPWLAALVSRQWRAVRIEAVPYGYLIDSVAARQKRMGHRRSTVVG